MIYTITPNPALDLGGTVETLTPNEKNYVHNETRFPGGNAINAARIIQRLGVPVLATGFLGGGVGNEIRHLLATEEVRENFIEVSESTRVNITVSNRKTHLQMRLSFPGPRIRARERENLFRLLQNKKKARAWVLGGSFPAGFSVEEAKRIVRLGKLSAVPCWVDVPGKLLRPILKAGPAFIKPNLIEFQDLIGKKVHTLEKVQVEARKLLCDVPVICISSVEGGALLVSRSHSWFGRIPRVKLKSTVGAGDSMVGAMAALSTKWKQPLAELPGEALGELLRFGLAAACATLAEPGTHLGSAAAIRRYARITRVREV